GIVVPAGGTDAETLVTLVDHIQLGQQIDTVGNVGTSLAKVVVTVVVVRCAQHGLVGTFGAHTVVVLDGVIEANGPVLTASINLERLSRRRAGQHDGRGQQAAPQVARIVTYRV